MTINNNSCTINSLPSILHRSQWWSRKHQRGQTGGRNLKKVWWCTEKIWTLELENLCSGRGTHLKSCCRGHGTWKLLFAAAVLVTFFFLAMVVTRGNSFSSYNLQSSLSQSKAGNMARASLSDPRGVQLRGWKTWAGWKKANGWPSHKQRGGMC